jgi:hypothetical protein
MQTSDRLRIFRSLGLATAAFLLIGGAVLGSQAISGQRDGEDADASPTASAAVSDDSRGDDASTSEDSSESPEASPEESEDTTPDEDVNDDDASQSPEASASDDEAESEAEDASGSPEPSESPDDHGGNSGPGGDGSDDD